MARSGPRPELTNIFSTGCLAAANVRVSEVEPERAVMTEDAPSFSKDLDKPSNILINCRFQSDLSLDPVVSQEPVRRGGNDCMNGFLRHILEAGFGVADDDPAGWHFGTLDCCLAAAKYHRSKAPDY